MPELPDLEAYRTNLLKKLHHKKLQSITVENTRKLTTPAATLQKALVGQPLESIDRVGKTLQFKFGNGHVLGMHLMLHGKLYFFKDHNTEKYPIATLLFDGGTGLVLTDWQSAAHIMLDPENKTAPDAFDKAFSEIYLKDLLSKKRVTIKQFLLDQDNVQGIGNAYADDILWDARISPFSICNKIPAAAVKKLYKSIHDVLTKAEKNILKSEPDIINGEVRDFMLVHNKKLKESPTGAAIETSSQKGRTTYYTAEQQLFE
ncbi:Fpg/Nei family DNA glycosylase [Chitinophaga silvatica]|uniref:Fpg/Nei family DNA glycosylase n=1 Tax=Chitinophaga silvatica TaxID=2282649 RepID=A0A3E1Y4T8_9BACT|nr:DNA-formamidopyrimidine glycosylase family protein [Chitinophaga silvatica]RFS19694.1 Fpg/Nei family DNA glycosylase [Chitinophaga silvatica]